MNHALTVVAPFRTASVSERFRIRAESRGHALARSDSGGKPEAGLSISANLTPTGLSSGRKSTARRVSAGKV